MKTVRMLQQGRVLLPTVLVADRATERMRGLLGRDSLPPGSGMLLAPCGSLHTLGMRFALDVIYFDSAWRVVRTVRTLPPWRCSFGGWRARAALEIQAGSFDFATLDPALPILFEAPASPSVHVRHIPFCRI
jgi:uncharacterized membrane protein (UPF0127 family)